MKKIILVLILFLSTTIFAEYREYKTDYFDFVYNENIKGQVVDLIKKADGIAKKEFEFYGFKPTSKYVIRVLDNVDYENGFTNLNSITLYLNVPRSNIIEKNYSNWLEYVFTHELTHLILNNKVGGLFKYIWGIDKILQSFYTPTWLHEGLAVYSETKFTDGGRGLSDRFNMMIKAKYNNEKFKGLSLAGNYNYNGRYPYIYGYSFISFFAEKYGEKRLVEAINYFTNHQISSAYSAFVKISKVSGKELNNEWKDYLKKKYQIKSNLVEGKKILNIDGEKSNLKIDEGKLYFKGNYRSNILEEKYNRGIFSLDLKTKKFKKEIDENISGGFDVKKGKIYYSTIKTNVLEDKIEDVSYEQKRMAYNYLNVKRGINFLKIPNGLVYIKRDKGQESLRILGGRILIKSDEGFQIGKLFYENGKIYFDSSKQGEIGNYIYSLDLKNLELNKISNGVYPFLDKNNNKLYFSKDIDGVYNIVSLNLGTMELKQITDVNYGAYEPVIYNKNLYYLNYFAKGEYIYKLEEKDFLNKNISEDKLNKKIKLREEIKLKKDIKNEGESILKLKDDELKNSLSLDYGIILPNTIDLSFIDKLNRENYNVGAYYLKDTDGKWKTEAKLSYNHKIAGFTVFGIDLAAGDLDNYYGARISLPLYLKRMKKDSYLSFRISNKDMEYGLGYWRFNLEQTISDGIPLNKIGYKDEHLDVSYYWSKFIQEIDEPIFLNQIYNLKEDSTLSPKVKITTNKLLKAKLTLKKDILIEKGEKTGTVSLDKIYFKIENTYLKEYLWGTQADILKYETGIDFYMTYHIESRFAGGVYYYINDFNNINFNDDTPYMYFRVSF